MKEEEKRREQQLEMMDIAVKKLAEEKPSYPVEKVKSGDIVTILSIMPGKKKEDISTYICSGIVGRVGKFQFGEEAGSSYVVIAKELSYHRYPDGREVPEKIGDVDVIPVKHIRHVIYHGNGQGKIIPSSEFVEKGQKAIGRYWDELHKIAGIQRRKSLSWVPGQALIDKQGKLCDDLEEGNVIKISLLDLESVFELIKSHIIWEAITKEKGQSKLLDIVNAYKSLHQEWIWQDREEAVRAFNSLAEARKEMERLQRDLLRRIKEEEQRD